MKTKKGIVSFIDHAFSALVPSTDLRVRCGEWAERVGSFVRPMEVALSELELSKST